VLPKRVGGTRGWIPDERLHGKRDFDEDAIPTRAQRLHQFLLHSRRHDEPFSQHFCTAPPLHLLCQATLPEPHNPRMKSACPRPNLISATATASVGVPEADSWQIGEESLHPTTQDQGSSKSTPSMTCPCVTAMARSGLRQFPRIPAWATLYLIQSTTIFLTTVYEECHQSAFAVIAKLMC